MKKLILVLAICCTTGCGVTSTGDLASDVRLAEMYEKGIGVTKDIATSIRWYTKAAKAGSAEAQFRLGVFYDEGLSVARDAKQAFMWFQKAADQGVPQAIFNVANAYRNGDGVAQDYTKALELYKEAALSGYAPAAHNVGAMFGNGEGTPQNYAEAYLWLLVSSKLGIKEDLTYKNNFITGLTKEKIVEIEKVANDMVTSIQKAQASSSSSVSSSQLQS